MATRVTTGKSTRSEDSDLAARRRELFAQLLEDQGLTHADAIRHRGLTGPAPLSYAQRRLWFLDRLNTGGTAYRVQGSVPLTGPLNTEALRHSIEMIVARHEALRTTFREGEDGAVQIIHESGPLTLPFVDLTVLPEGERAAEWNRVVQEMAEQPFDLESGPLFCVKLTKVAPDVHLLTVAMHHIISDGWSLQIFLRELGQFYGQLCRGVHPELPPLRIQYADFACWQLDWLQGEMMEQQLAYWRGKLGGKLSDLDLPRDRPRPRIQGFRGARQVFTVPPEIVEPLNTLSRRHRATLFMTMLAAFQVLLARLSGSEDILVGTPVSGRNRLETEDLIGFFIQTVVLRADLSGNPTFAELLDQVRETTLGAQAHQDVPFEKLVEELHPQRDLSRTPIFQVLFNMVNVPSQEPVNVAGLQMGKILGLDTESKFDLTVYAVETEGVIYLDFLYNPDLFDEPRIAEMGRQYRSILTQIAESPDTPVWALSMVTKEAQDSLPDVVLPLPPTWHGAVHERFSEQANRSPHRLAVSDPHEQWNYEQLEKWSNRLAHHLQSTGIGRRDVVAIYVPRSATLVWAILGVLKSGAAFVVLDPAYPSSYLLECLRACEPKVWIQPQSVNPPAALLAFSSELPSGGQLRLPLRKNANFCDWLKAQPADLPHIPIDPEDTAYVAFTSGSTGKPKGIVGSHRPLSHFIDWYTQAFKFSSEDRFSMLSGLSHDPLLRDIFTPLCMGASLHVPQLLELSRVGDLQSGPLEGVFHDAPRPSMLDSRSQPRPLDDGARYKTLNWLFSEKITVLHCTPPFLDLLAESQRDLPRKTSMPTLRYAFLGGDSLWLRQIMLLRSVAPEVTCVNFYGATETPQAMGFYVVPSSEQQQEQVPIGRGIEGVQLLVLNRSSKLAGIGELGEIYVRTPYLATGYLQEQGSVTGFLPNHFTNATGDRLFRTGDLGRYLPDGNVVCHGRSNDQVKIRGHRIELQHVHSVIAGHPSVARCVVVTHQDTSNDRRLIAYFVPSARNGQHDSSELHDYVKAQLPAHMVPSFFMPVNDIPLTPNGKINYRALPEPDASAAAKAAYVPPRSKIEQQLTQIWEKVLNVSPLGIKDNFFDMGGHSLLAVRLFTAIERTFNRSLPVATIFQAPTVELFAEVLEQKGWGAPFAALVPIKPGGSAAPFFCVHSLGANLVSYGALANRVGEDQPFYGLQPQGLDGKEAPHTRIEEMAAHYVEAIRTVQRHGPYYLGGVCLGGVIAFEMAQQLIAAGEQVAGLLLMDSYCPGTPRHLPRRTLDYGLVEMMDWYVGETMLLPLPEKIKFVFERLKGFGRRLVYSVRICIGRSVPAFAPAEAQIERIMAHVKAVNSQAWHQYSPQHYPGKIVLFWCSEIPTRCYRDRRLAWSEIANGGLEVRAVPGNHMTMVEPPYVEVLAQILRECLQKAQQEAEPLARTSASSVC